MLTKVLSDFFFEPIINKQHILVTGGGGFLGREIVKRLLAQGNRVSVLGRSAQPDLEQCGVRVVRCDLSQIHQIENAFSGVDAVFHVAAKAGVWGSWESYFNANVVSTRNVITACQQYGIRSLVYTSTPSVVFNRQEFHGDNESLPYGRHWLCHYAHTKAIAERSVLAAHDPSPNGLKVCALRPHLIWGIGDPHIVPRIIKSHRAGRLAIVGDGKNRVDITHVANAAHAHLLALQALTEGRAGGKAYFISQGEPVVLWDWINTLLTRLGEPPLTRQVSLRKAYTIGFVMEALWKSLRLKGEPPMTRFIAMELGKNHFFDTSAARHELGYQPEISTADGMTALIESMRAT